MITTSEKAIQKSITFPTRSVQQTSFLWTSFACHELVRSPTDSWPKTAPAALSRDVRHGVDLTPPASVRLTISVIASQV
jgi:hypothetical protein